MIDSLDNLKLPDSSKIRKNPYYEDIIKNGFSISVHYSPEDVAEIINGKQKFDFDLLEHDPDELAAFEKYHKVNQFKRSTI